VIICCIQCGEDGLSLSEFPPDAAIGPIQKIDSIRVGSVNDQEKWQKWFEGQNSSSGWTNILRTNSAILSGYDLRVKVKSEKTADIFAFECCSYRKIKSISSSIYASTLEIEENDVLDKNSFLDFWIKSREKNTSFDYRVEYKKKDFVWGKLDSFKGVVLWEKNGWYVQEIDLSQGAYLSLGYESITPASNAVPSPEFKRIPISEHWDRRPENTIAVTNAQVFNFMGHSGETSILELSLPLKDQGEIITCGFENSLSYKLKLEIDEDKCQILSYNNLFNDFQTVSDALKSSLAIVGFDPVLKNKNRDWVSGRNMIGIRDNDGDGKNESLYIFTGDGQQEDPYNSLINDFNCSKVIMLDGDLSAQMIHRKGYQYASEFGKRNIPSVLYIRY